jgi:uncharacterized membrane protein YqjE
MAEARTNELTARDDLPSLVERLFSDVTQLFDQKLALLKVELKEEVNAYIRGGIVIMAAGVVVAVGFALANVALAFAVSTLFSTMDLTQPARYALGFVITGLAYLLIGTVVILITKNRLAQQGLVPRRTVRELQRDKDWLQKEL